MDLSAGKDGLLSAAAGACKKQQGDLQTAAPGLFRMVLTGKLTRDPVATAVAFFVHQPVNVQLVRLVQAIKGCGTIVKIDTVVAFIGQVLLQVRKKSGWNKTLWLTDASRPVGRNTGSSTENL